MTHKYEDDQLISLTNTETDLIDPDPFVLGLQLLNVLFAGFGILSSRRRHAELSAKDVNRFRVRWHRAKTSVILAQETLGDFRAFTARHEYGRTNFELGGTRLKLPRTQITEYKRLLRKINRTMNDFVEQMDRLSDFLGPEHSQVVEAIMRRVMENQRPHTYDAVILIVADTIKTFDQLLEDTRQVFE